MPNTIEFYRVEFGEFQVEEMEVSDQLWIEWQPEQQVDQGEIRR